MSGMSRLDMRLREVSNDIEEYNALKKEVDKWFNSGGNLYTMPRKAQQVIEEVIEGQRKGDITENQAKLGRGE